MASKHAESNTLAQLPCRKTWWLKWAGTRQISSEEWPYLTKNVLSRTIGAAYRTKLEIFCLNRYTYFSVQPVIDKPQVVVQEEDVELTGNFPDVDCLAFFWNHVINQTCYFLKNWGLLYDKSEYWTLSEHDQNGNNIYLGSLRSWLVLYYIILTLYYTVCSTWSILFETIVSINQDTSSLNSRPNTDYS